MVGTAPRPQSIRLHDRWVIATPVAFAILFAISLSLFGIGASTTVPRAEAEFSSSNSQISQSAASAKLSPDARFIMGPNHICDVCEGYHGGIHRPNYCHDCIASGDTPVIPDYGPGHH